MNGVDRLVEAAARWYLAHDAGRRARRSGSPPPRRRSRGSSPCCPRSASDDVARAPRARSPSALVGRRACPRRSRGRTRSRPELMQAPDIIAVAERTGRAVEDVTRAFHTLAARLDIVWLLGALDELPQPTRTQRWAVQAVREDCLEALAELAQLRARWPPASGADAGRRGRRVPRGARGAQRAASRAVTASLTVEGTGDLPGAHARRPRPARARRLMARLVLGPLLRYAGDDEATVWVETDAPCEVEVLGCRERTFHVAGHHYALVHVTGLEPATTTPYEVAARRRAGLARARRAVPAERDPDATAADAPFRHRLGLVPRQRAAPSRRTRCARTSTRTAARSTRCACSPTTCAATTPEDVAARARAARRPGLRRRGARRRCASFIRAAPRRRACRRARPSANFEEYTRLYRESWGGAAHPLAALDGADGDGLRRPRRPRRLEHVARRGSTTMRATGWWDERIVGGFVTYWLYQHMGNLSPAAPRRGRALRDGARRGGRRGPELLREFAFRADREVAGTRWSYCRDFGRSRLRDDRLARRPRARPARGPLDARPAGVGVARGARRRATSTTC